MALFEALQHSSGFLVFTVSLLGLMVGSFLNVVILRLPAMMEQAWKRECREILDQPAEVLAEPISLSSPASRCPTCGAGIKPWHNIPVFGWLMLRGKCGSCDAAISAQYPIIEIITAVMSAACALHFGLSAQLLPALILTWSLIVLTVIDLRTMLLPDSITLPLLWLGIGLSFWSIFTSMDASVAGAMFGYLSLWSVFQLFKLITGKEGMGFGDFKLFAALGAWLGWQALPMIILLSSIVGAVVGICLIVFRRQGREVPIPFGPYLAGAGWIALIWGDSLKSVYLSASGLN